MGADLYIKNMNREAQYRGFEVSDEARAAGYFRDCYNGYGLFSIMSATLGQEFSWWQLCAREDLPWLNDPEDGRVLSVAGVKQWRDEIAPSVEAFCATDKLWGKNWDKKRILIPKRSHKYTDCAYYHKWAQGLLAFLDLAIEKGSPIIFSC